MLYFIGNKVVVKLTLNNSDLGANGWLIFGIAYLNPCHWSILQFSFVWNTYIFLAWFNAYTWCSWYTCIWNDWNSEMLQYSHAHYFTINGCQFWTEIMVFTLKKISRDHLCQPICPICYETDSVQMTYKIQQRTFNIT